MDGKPIKAMGKIEYVKKYLPFWEKLSKEEVNRIEISLSNKTFSKKELISSNLDFCIGMIIVDCGDVRASIISEDGRQITLFHVKEKEVCVISASCVIAQLTFETVVMAEKETTLWVIPSATLAWLADRNIYVKAYMYELLAERFSSVVWVMEQVIFKGFDQRLASFLLSCYEKSGSKEIEMTQEEIASEVNSAREVVARMLKQFNSDNLVELKRGKIKLLNIDALKKI